MSSRESPENELVSESSDEVVNNSPEMDDVEFDATTCTVQEKFTVPENITAAVIWFINILLFPLMIFQFTEIQQYEKGFFFRFGKSRS